MSAADIESSLTQIKRELRQFNAKIERLERLKGKRGAEAEIAKTLEEVKSLKQTYLSKKGLTKSLLKRAEGRTQVSLEREFKHLTDEYKELNQRYKELNMDTDRSELMAGATAPTAFDPHNATNDEMLEAGRKAADTGTNALRGALQNVTEADAIGQGIVKTLEEDREKLKRIHGHVDGIDDDLNTANKLITQFMKRLYTDKVIWAFTCLIVLGIVGIIIYASVNPDQDSFNVPDQIKPPSPSDVEQKTT